MAAEGRTGKVALAKVFDALAGNRRAERFFLLIAFAASVLTSAVMAGGGRNITSALAKLTAAERMSGSDTRETVPVCADERAAALCADERAAVMLGTNAWSRCTTASYNQKKVIVPPTINKHDRTDVKKVSVPDDCRRLNVNVVAG
jgi:hypothetical protein